MRRGCEVQLLRTDEMQVMNVMVCDRRPISHFLENLTKLVPSRV